MQIRTRSLIVLAAFGIVACGRAEPRNDVALDGSRPGDSVTPVVDAPKPDSTALPKPSEPTPSVKQPAPRPAPRPKPSAPPAATPPAPPAAEPSRARTLASGTTIAATTIDSIHSHVTKVGDQVRVQVASDVMDANRRTVIPSGSEITLRVNEIGEAANRGEKGILTLSANDVVIDGVSHSLSATATDYTYEMKARPIGVGEVAKTGAGAAAGAIIGRVIGGKTGTIIGAVGGGAAGAAVAAKSANRDIIVHAGTAMTLTLTDGFVRRR